tara:strand:- start:511 stop:1236 length:726 start_codon:yes stop_codon:yes gene_type:complete
VKEFYDKTNSKWATDTRYENLGETFALMLVDACSDLTGGFEIGGDLKSRKHPLGDSGLFVHANSAHLQSGSYQFKRFVRIGSEGYHPNALQIYIESYAPGTKFDGEPRDESDSQYERVGFGADGIPDDEIGVFVGMTAILSSKEKPQWSMMAREDEVAPKFIEEDFREIDEIVADSIVWAEDFIGDSDLVKLVRSDRVSRLRIKLPGVSEDAGDWSDSRLEEILPELVGIFGESFAEISRV